MLLLFLLPAIFTIPSSAQTKSDVSVFARLPAGDSIKLKGYLDTLSTCSIYSMKHQRYIDSALQLVPAKASWWQLRGMPLMKQKKYEIGMPYLDSAVKYDKSGHYIEYRAFMKCIFQKSYTGAISDFELAEKANGNSGVMDHSYDFYRGVCYLQLNQLDSAERYMRKTIEKELKRGKDWVHFMSWFYMGIIQYEKEQYTEAIKSFDAGLALYARFSDIKYYKALCLLDINDRKAALATIAECLEDLKSGYTINEDNMFYEQYPYQITKRLVESELEWLKETDTASKP